MSGAVLDKVEASTTAEILRRVAADLCLIHGDHAGQGCIPEHGVVDLFAGPGGWDVAGQWLGLPIVGVELEPNAVATRLAAGHLTIHGSVTAIPLHVLALRGVRGLIASPPCQTFSAAGNGSGRRQLDLVVRAVQRLGRGEWPQEEIDATNDPRTALVLEPLRWALALQPEWLAFEQVPQVLPVWEAMAEVLREHGWHVVTGYVHSEQYGVGQTRKRAVLMGHRRHPVSLPKPTHSKYHSRTPDRLDPDVLPWVSMAETLGWGMPDRPYVTVATGTAAGGTDPQALGGSGARKIVNTAFDEGRWVDRGQPEAAVPGDTSWVDVRPSPTIVGSFAPDVVAAPGYRKAGDPPRQRTPGSVRVSVQEAARLQSFPDDYPWHGKEGKQYEQVGNAVPPVLALAVLCEVVGVPFDQAPAGPLS